MKKYKFRYRHLFLAPVMLAVIYLAWITLPMIFNPMRRPVPLIRHHVLWHTPIGACIEETIEFLENNVRWGSPVINRSDGFLHPVRSVVGPDGRPFPASIGEQSVQNRYRHSVPLFLDRTVRILWGFDENGKLIEVYVESWFVI
jgi:hypothetical protein